MALLVAICQFELIIQESNSLKSKRFVLSSLKTRMRNKFNVSVAEIDYNDKWQRSLLGVSIVANDRKYLDKTINKIMNFIELDSQIEIIDHEIEIV